MKRLTLGLLALAACAKEKPPTPPAAPTKVTAAATPGDDLARGEYLVRIAACMECHTPRTSTGALDETKLMAGGIPFGGSWGTVHSANVSAVAAKFEPALLEAAIRGQLAFKFQMPTDLYATLARDDLRDMVAYLRTLAPIEVPAPDNTLDVKWRPPEPLPVLTVPQSAPEGVTVERGEYLARLAICKDCHTPRNADGSYDEAHAFAGGGFRLKLSDGAWLTPPNLTPDAETGIGTWSDDDIITAMRAGKRPDGRVLHGAMPWEVAFSKMTDVDAKALVKYLRSLKPVRREVKRITAAQATLPPDCCFAVPPGAFAEGSAP